MVWSFTIPFADASVLGSSRTKNSSVATKFYRSDESSPSRASLQWQESSDYNFSNCTTSNYSSSLLSVNTMTANSLETPLQVDYQKCCTPLYKKIEQKDWENVEFFLENHHCTWAHT
jgi:hypothetical protein